MKATTYQTIVRFRNMFLGLLFLSMPFTISLYIVLNQTNNKQHTTHSHKPKIDTSNPIARKVFLINRD